MTVNIRVSAQLDRGALQAALDQVQRDAEQAQAKINKPRPAAPAPAAPPAPAPATRPAPGGEARPSGNTPIPGIAPGTAAPPLPPNAAAQVNAVIQQMRHFISLTPSLAQRIKQLGMVVNTPADLHWERLYPAAQQRARVQAQFAAYMGHPVGMTQPGPHGPGGHGGAPPGGARPGLASVYGGMIGRGAGGILASAPGGGALSAGAGGFARGAAAGGLAGGLGGLGIGLGIFAATAVAQRVMAAVGNAQQEAIQTDTLKRALGDTAVGFRRLRDTVRATADNLALTDSEAQSLFRGYVGASHLAGPRGMQAAAEEVMIAGGLARSFGMDPAESTTAVGRMRGAGALRSTDDVRRFALLIGEGIAASGAFASASEVMDAVGDFATSQTRAGLTGANATGYVGALAGLMGSGVPGLDASGSASILGRANAAIAGGGGRGEASQNFIYGAFQRRLGLDPLQSLLMQEQGAFGTGRGTFGAGSLYSRWAQQNGVTPPRGAGSDATTIGMLQEELRRAYPNPAMRVNALAGLLGLSNSQAMALDTIGPRDMGAVRRLLDRAGVKVGDVNASGISALAQVAVGDGDTLGRVAEGLHARTNQRLTDAERAELREAQSSGDQEKLREVLARLVARRDQEETEGSRTRQSITGLENVINRAASTLLGPLNAIRDATVFMAGGGRKTEAQIRAQMRSLELREVGEREEGELASLRSQRDAEVSDLDRRFATGEVAGGIEYQAEMNRIQERHRARQAEVRGRFDAERRNLQPEGPTPSRGAGRVPATPEQATRVQELRGHLERFGWSEAQAAGLAANALHESSMDPRAINRGDGRDGSDSVGLFQWNSSRVRDFMRVIGKHPRDATVEEQARFVDWELRNTEAGAGARLRRATEAGDAAGIASRFYIRPGNADAEAGARAATARRLSRGGNDLPLPPPAPPGEAAAMPGGGQQGAALDGGGTQRIEVSGDFYLRDPGGAALAAPVAVRTTIGRPQPFGALA